MAQIDQKAWEAAYLSEIERIGAETQGRVLRSVFFGGGTPSLMDPDVVDAILTKVRATWPIANDLEVTLEANPTSVEAGRFAGYRAAGVNRVSMGIQALNDADLRALGRLHTAQEALAAFDIARNVFARVSFDLIYARQGQSLLKWAAELKQALGLAVDHLSLYQLTVETGTAFGERNAAGKLRGLPGDDLAADMYEATQDICGDAGFAGYEVSNHARPGCESIHNQVYWRYGDYAGIGPGAHGRLTLDGARYAVEAPRAPAGWLSQVRKTGHGDLSRDVLSVDEQIAEFLLMGMRLRGGVDLSRFSQLQSEVYVNKIRYLSNLGMVETTGTTLQLTKKGYPVLNAVLRALLED